MNHNPIEPIKMLMSRTLTAQHVIGAELFSLGPEEDCGVAASLLEVRGFSVAGVTADRGSVQHYVTSDTLRNAQGTVGEVAEPIPSALCIEKSLPLSRLIAVLLDRPFTFVLADDRVQAIITRADLATPAVGVAVLALLMVIEAQLAELVKQAKPDALERLLSPNRRQRAEELFQKRSKDGSDLGIDDCFCFADWVNLAGKTECYRWIGYHSAAEFKWAFKPLEELRNDLAHARSILSSRSASEAIELVVSVMELAERLVEVVADAEAVGARTVNIGLIGRGGATVQIAGLGADASVSIPERVYVVSGFNPDGRALTLDENEARHAKLRHVLEAELDRRMWSEARLWSGLHSWEERGFALMGMTVDHVSRIARDFGQGSFFIVDGDTVTTVRTLGTAARPVDEPVQTVPRIPRTPETSHG